MMRCRAWCQRWDKLIPIGLIVSSLLVASCATCSLVLGQTESDLSRDESEFERYLSILLRRPQPGTALDKVVSQSVRNGKMPAFLQRLEKKAEDLRATAPAESAAHTLVMALIFQSQSEWTKALPLFEVATKSAEHEWVARTEMARILERLQRWADIPPVLTPLASEPRLRKMPRSQSIEVLKLLARAQVQSGHPVDAQGSWLLIERLAPNDMAIVLQISELAAEEGELEFALECVSRSLPQAKSSQQRAELSMRIGDLRARLGRLDEALVDFESLLERAAPESWIAKELRRRIEKILMEEEDDDATIRYYSAWIEKHPEDTQAIRRLADAYASAANWEEAEKLFRRLMKLLPSDVEPRILLANMLVGREEPRLAAQELSKAHTLQPKNRDVIVKWGEAIAADQSRSDEVRKSQAADVWRKILHDNDKDAGTWMFVAQLLEGIGYRDESLRMGQTAIELASSDLALRIRFAEMLLRCERSEEARKTVEAMLATGLSDKELQVAVARALYDLRFQKAAIDRMVTVCKANPSIEDRLLLANWHEADSELDRASDQYQKARTQFQREQGESFDEDTFSTIVEGQIRLAARSGQLNQWIQQLQSQLNSASAVERSRLWWELAIAENYSGNTLRAVDAIRGAVHETPQMYSYWLLLAQFQKQLQRYEEAAETYASLAKIEPRLESTHRLSQAECLAMAGLANEAIEICEQLANHGSLNSTQVSAMADIALRTKRPDLARAYLQTHYTKQPADSEIARRLIELHIREERFSEAAQLEWGALEQASQPEQRIARLESLVDLHARLGTLNELKKKLDRHWRRNGLFSEHRRWDALLVAKSEDFPEAEKALRALLQIEPNSIALREQLVSLYRKSGEIEKELAELVRLRLREPSRVKRQEFVDRIMAYPGLELSDLQVQEFSKALQGATEFRETIDDFDVRDRSAWGLRFLELAPEELRTTSEGLAREALLALKLNQIPRARKSARQLLSELYPLAEQIAADRTVNAKQEELTRLQVAWCQQDDPQLLDTLLSAKWTVETAAAILDQTSPARVRMSKLLESKSDQHAIALVVLIKTTDSNSDLQNQFAEFQSRVASQFDERQLLVRSLFSWLVVHWIDMLPAQGNRNQRAPSIGTNQREGSAEKTATRIETSLSLNRMKAPWSEVAPGLHQGLVNDWKVVANLRQNADKGDSLAALFALLSEPTTASVVDSRNPSKGSLVDSSTEAARRVERNLGRLGELAPYAPPQLVMDALERSIAMQQAESVDRFASLLVQLDLRAFLPEAIETLLKTRNRKYLAQAMETQWKNAPDSFSLAFLEFFLNDLQINGANLEARELLSFDAQLAIVDAAITQMVSSNAFNWSTATLSRTLSSTIARDASYSEFEKEIEKQLQRGRKNSNSKDSVEITKVMRLLAGTSLMPRDREAILKSAAIVANERGQLDGWLEHLNAWSEQAPREGTKYGARQLALATSYALVGRTLQCKQVLDRLVSEDSVDANMQFLRGEWLYTLQFWNDSTKAFLRAENLPRQGLVLRAQRLVDLSIEAGNEVECEKALDRLEEFGLQEKELSSLAFRLLRKNWLRLAESCLFGIPRTFNNDGTAESPAKATPLGEGDLSLIEDPLIPALAELLKRTVETGGREDVQRVARQIFHRHLEECWGAPNGNSTRFATSGPNQVRRQQVVSGSEQDLRLRMRPIVVGLPSDDDVTRFLRSEANRLSAEGASDEERFRLSKALIARKELRLASGLIAKLDLQSLPATQLTQLADTQYELGDFASGERLFLASLRSNSNWTEDRLGKLLSKFSLQVLEPLLLQIARDPELRKSITNDSIVPVLGLLIQKAEPQTANQLITHWVSMAGFRDRIVAGKVAQLVSGLPPDWQTGLATEILQSENFTEVDFIDASSRRTDLSILASLLFDPAKTDDVRARYSQSLRTLAKATRGTVKWGAVALAIGIRTNDEPLIEEAVQTLESAAQPQNVSLQGARDALLRELIRQTSASQYRERYLARLLDLRVKLLDDRIPTAADDPRLALARLALSRADAADFLRQAERLFQDTEAARKGFAEKRSATSTSSNDGRVASGKAHVSGATALLALRNDLEQSSLWKEALIFDARLDSLELDPLVSGDRAWSWRIKQFAPGRQLQLSEYSLNAADKADKDWSSLNGWERASLPGVVVNESTSVRSLPGVFLLPDNAKGIVGFDPLELEQLLETEVPDVDSVGRWKALTAYHVAVHAKDIDRAARLELAVVEHLKRLVAQVDSRSSEREDRDWVVACVSILYRRLEQTPLNHIELWRVLPHALRRVKENTLWCMVILDRVRGGLLGEHGLVEDERAFLIELISQNSLHAEFAFRSLEGTLGTGKIDLGLDLLEAIARTQWFSSYCHKTTVDGNSMAPDEGQTRSSIPMWFANANAEIWLHKMIQKIANEAASENLASERVIRLARLLRQLLAVPDESIGSGRASNGGSLETGLGNLVPLDLHSASVGLPSMEPSLADVLLNLSARCGELEGVQKQVESSLESNRLSFRLQLLSGLLLEHQGRVREANQRLQSLLYALRSHRTSSLDSIQVNAMRHRLTSRAIREPTSEESLSLTQQLLQSRGGMHNLGDARVLLEMQLSDAIDRGDGDLLRNLCEWVQSASSNDEVLPPTAPLFLANQVELMRACLDRNQPELAVIVAEVWSAADIRSVSPAAARLVEKAVEAMALESQRNFLQQKLIQAQSARLPWTSASWLPPRQLPPKRFLQAKTPESYNAVERESFGTFAFARYIALLAIRHHLQADVLKRVKAMPRDREPIEVVRMIIRIKLQDSSLLEDFDNLCDQLESMRRVPSQSQFISQYLPLVMSLMEEALNSPDLRERAVEFLTQQHAHLVVMQANNLTTSRPLDDSFQGDGAADPIRFIEGLLARHRAMLLGNAPNYNQFMHWLPAQERDHHDRFEEDAGLTWSRSDSAVVARSSNHPAYLFLKYPVQGDFSARAVISQTSERKFGLGFGGLTLAPTSSSKMVRLFGASGRSVYNEIAVKLGYATELWVSASKNLGRVQLATPAGPSRDDHASGPAFLYLYSLGPGEASFSQWSWSGTLQVAKEVNLFDQQLRLWNATSGRLTMPSISLDLPKSKLVEVPPGVVPDAVCEVEAEGLRIVRTAGTSDQALSLHFLRPIDHGEELAFDVLADATSLPVFPALDRVAFILKEGMAELHWVTDGSDSSFGIPPDNQSPLTPEERLGTVRILPHQWNRIVISIQQGTARLSLNGQDVCRMKLETSLQPQFGLVIPSGVTSARLRNATLKGAWPDSIPVQQLFEFADRSIKN